MLNSSMLNNYRTNRDFEGNFSGSTVNDKKSRSATTNENSVPQIITRNAFSG